ncbi:hypothetical protein DUNSADRAFT_36 [Dunaliella salina]|uniref:VDE lipocalin domain-containing protein n=1 Tax=Dunaliella salina TaxID=3046 RepID=A0ABQ7HAN5_DUNSA|nr:hypothetical protein DUNSADRAFT_36 [Dunaliella salina]|eukprot:KAF5843914.1 hypothetical protein DUNSADRAFT_36 [Dunaliella salina]
MFDFVLLLQTPVSPQILVGVGVSEPSVVSLLQQLSSNQGAGAPGVRIFFESPPELQSASSLQGWAPWGSKNPITAALEQMAPWSKPAKTAVLWDTLSVYMTTKGTDLKSLWCMVTNCGTQIKDCVTNPVCKAGLDCLQSCQFNDQICQYRCIVAHETPTFEQFALCILQKHNCRGLTAEMNMQPGEEHNLQLYHASTCKGSEMNMQPGGEYEEYQLSHAYDYFPCQHQLFSRGKGRGQMWYEPVFKVLLDNAEVWRRRRYRVRRASTPGTFHFSVLDNGLSYSGAVLGTRDGSYPSAPDALQRLDASLGKAGIRPWELSFVDNR